MINTSNGFIKFLIKAKVNSYASNKSQALPSRPESRDIHFQEGDYRYIDTYLGSFDFIGQEAVWYKGKSIWGMNYFGRTLVNDIPIGFIEFLKNALKKVSPEAPYRGPKRFQCDQYEYSCIWSGDVALFKGSEKIHLNNKEIYTLQFHGGTLK